MANSTSIDQVVDPVAVEQFVTLKTAGKELRVELVALLETAVKLNATLGGSSPASFAKNVKAATDATAQLIAADQKVTDNKQKQAEKQEQIVNKYLITLSKQAAAQERQDAKDIANAEAKAAKLQAIQDKADQERLRKANVQFPASQDAPNPVTMDDSPAVRYEPLITGQEDMAITASKSTEAITAESAAMAEQAEVLAGLSSEYRANIETLLALQVERAANGAELKALTVEDAANGERAVFLTAEQIRLKTAISQVNSELLAQTKATNFQSTSVSQLDAELATLRNQYYNVMTAEDRATVSGEALRLQIATLDSEIKAIKVSTGQTSAIVGDYTNAINKSTIGTQLADRVTNQFIRSIIRMGVQFLLIGIIFKAAEAIYDYIKALNVFNPVATEAEMRQKALVEAFASGDYSKAIENVEQLASTFDLVKEGLENSDDAINKYNETMGKMYGYVNNLNDAQQGFIDHKKEYIQTIIDEAAAQAIAADSAQQIADLAKKNQEMQNYNDQYKDFNDPKKYDEAVKNTGAEFVNLTRQQMRENIQEMADNKKRMDEIVTNSVTAMDNIYSGTGKKKPSPGSGTSDPAADSRTKLLNSQLEAEKEFAQERMNNDKLSYATRNKYLDDFYTTSAQIEKNNEVNELQKLPAKDARRAEIEADANNKLLELQNQYQNAKTALNDKQYKQDQEILKNNLEKQRDLFKEVMDDPNVSYDGKLIALQSYNDRSQALIKADYDDQKKEAGKNAEAITIAEQNRDKATLDLARETADEKLKIQKKNLSDILAASKQSEQEQLETIDNGSKLALRGLTRAKDDKINALSLQRAREKISEKKYNEELLAINDQFNIDKISQEIATQQTILAVKQGNTDATYLRAKLTPGTTPEQLSKIKSDGAKNAQPTIDKIADLGIDLTNAKSKQTVDQTKGKAGESEEDKKKIEQAATDATVKAIDEVNSLRQKAFEAEMKRLEEQGRKIDENAEIEKAAIGRSMDTTENKNRREQTAELQTASLKNNLQIKENELKRKAAIADKEATIAKIIATGALAIVSAFATTPAYLGIILGAIVSAAVGVELATAVATKIPAYAKGTGPGGTKRGGLAWVGEKGVEHAKLPSGQEFYTPGVATVMNLPKGTVITPNHMLPETPKWVSNRTDNSDVVAAIDRLARKEQPRPSRSKLSGWVEAQRQADAWNDYSQKHFR